MTLDCFVCERMRVGNPGKHGSRAAASTQRCLLCNRDFCNEHRGNEESVCEINHQTYFRQHPDLHGKIYATMQARLEAEEAKLPSVVPTEQPSIVKE
ncbi:hypothetical protein CDEST_09045 [Colletotrichum destructivum]|uniref:AN1-type domain-containing protein n=1 Tax=Colletotrichum destructivum TaxID=34406 RepID=A0AAX4ILN6_9PEZI|nr:hypothetical protein CDEST_09045 [Colletotrichum destructivum]